MNKIKLDLGTGYDPSLKIKIDDIDIFTIAELRNMFKPTSLTSFLLNEWEHRNLKYLENQKKMPRKNDVFNGIMLIGICEKCGCEGCHDLAVEIVTNKNTTKWKTCGLEFVFDTNEYKNEIQKIKNDYYSYSWESNEHKINRFCTEYIKMLKANNNIDIANIANDFNINTLNNIMEIYYYDELPEKEEENIIRNWRINWEGNSIEADWRLINELDEVLDENLQVIWTMEKNVIQNRTLYRKNIKISML